MSRLGAWAAWHRQGPPEPRILAAPRRAAVITAVIVALMLVRPGRRQVGWGIAAVTFAVMMALSRAYLGAHWLSDAIAGLLLGTSCAPLAAVAVDQAQRRHGRPAVAAAPPRSVPSTDRL